ncbi:MAG: ABC transporter substrate-binding protein [Planctomycetota bacterium]
MLFGLLPLLGLALSGCGRDTANDPSASLNGGSDAFERVAIQLNWYPEAEHGGVYQAQASGIYADAGLQVDIRPGGPSAPIAGELTLGRCQFAIANADDVVHFRREGADIVAVAAVVQNSPRCILVQTASGVDSLDKLKGLTLQCEAGRGFVEFMRKQGLLEGVREVPYAGSVAPLVADAKIAIQGYAFTEPLMAKQAGAEVNELMVSSIGWNPYSSVLVTTGDLVRDQPELVQSMVDATLRGWRDYLTDAAQANVAILEANRHGLTAETLEYGAAKLRELALPEQASLDTIGQMQASRWDTLVEQMDSLADENDRGKVKAQDCFTLQFLPSPKS